MSVGYLKALCGTWESQLQLAKDQKEEDFGKTARTLWGFTNKSYRQLYLEPCEGMDLSILPAPDSEVQGVPVYKARLQKCREFINVVLPFVHARVPNRMVSPRRPPLPGDLINLAQEMIEGISPDQLPPEIVLLQAASTSQIKHTVNERIVSFMLEFYLNYIVEEYGAKREQRTAIQEALVKGRGVVWHELTEGPTGVMPGSYYDTVDGLFIDPDCKQWRDAGYIFRERTWPAWRLADVFEVDIEKIRSAGRTNAASTGVDAEKDAYKWFEVWSRIGPGSRLYSARDTLRDEEQARTDAMDEVGNNIYFAFLPGLDYPLNIRPSLWESGTVADLVKRIQWPVAFYEDKANPFPCTPLDIYASTENPWAVSPLAAGISLQIFLDHIYGFVMGRLRSTARDIIITSKLLEASVRDAITSQADQVVVACEGKQVAELDKLVHVLQFPTMQTDVWRTIDMVGRAFELATGMDPLLYGGEPNRQMRSSKEASVREQHVTNRPNDYADAVEEWNSQVARAEGQLTRMYVKPEHIAPLFREQVTENPEEYGPFTALWDSLVNTDDPAEAVADLNYTVEAGSGRRKNKQSQIEDFQLISQTLAPTLQAYAAQGIVGPWNNYVDIIEETYDMPMGRLKLPEPAQQPQEGAETTEPGV